MEGFWRDSLILAAMIVLGAHLLSLVANLLVRAPPGNDLMTILAIPFLELLVVVFLGFVLYQGHRVEATPRDAEVKT
jgi:hypothetical protein